MRVAVTGATGFLGRSLVRRLRAEGLEVRCLLRPSSDPTLLLEGHDPAEGSPLELVRVAGQVPALVGALRGCSVLYHVASALKGAPSVLCRANVSASRLLFTASREAGTDRVVLVSSLGVHDTSPLPAGATVEADTPLDPRAELRDPYTLTKILQERLAWEERDLHGLPLVVLRPGVLFGPGRTLPITRLGLPIGPLLLWVPGRRQMPYTFVENCADALALAGLRPGVEGEAFDVVDDDWPSPRRMLRANRAMGQPSYRIPLPYPAMMGLASLVARWHVRSRGQMPLVLTPHRVQAQWKRLRYSNEKAKARLGWVPRVSAEEAVARTVRAAAAAGS